VKQKVTQGYQLMNEGDANRHVYVVFSGSVLVTYKGVHLMKLKRGSIFGYEKYI
jgi:signal-transduction protein with cAMP-binding, CBS, and nucleotidyltransferase domain